MSFSHCSFRGAQVTALPLHGLENCPSQLQKAHLSACGGRRGSPRGPPTPTHATLHNFQTSPSQCGSSSLPQSPSVALTLQHTQYRWVVALRYAKNPEAVPAHFQAPLEGSSPGKKDLQPAHCTLIKDINTNPPDVPLFSVFSCEHAHLFNFSKEECC